MGESASVGKIVAFIDPDSGEVRPAVITRVHSPHCVNLHMFKDCEDSPVLGNTVCYSSVTFAQPPTAGPATRRTFHFFNGFA